MSTSNFRWLSTAFLYIFIITSTLSPGLFSSSSVFALFNPDKDVPPPVVEVVNSYYTVEYYHYEDGTNIEKGIINGPPKPLPEFEESRNGSIQPLPSAGVISNFPSYDWVFGCSAVSGAMIAAYYDRNGYENMYVGPTNGGLMPLTDASWVTWFDGYDTYPNNPLIASHNGVDGRIIKGSIDDYWVRYDSTANDPYIGNWTQHTWSDAIGDYMKTSQSAFGNSDGSTAFFTWTSSGDPLSCSDMEDIDIDHIDGTYGRKLFYEARGYSVGDCYNQKTENNGGGFSLSDFQAEIDAGHPVLLNLAGHSIVGYGYSGSTIYIRDTWSSDSSFTPTMTWGGSYDGMALQSVSVVRLESATSIPSVPLGVSASDGTYTDRVRITWSASDGANHYKVFRNTSNSTTGVTQLISGHPASPFDDFSAAPGVTYFYWVKACNPEGCSNFSASNSGYVQVPVPSVPIGVMASDGTFSDKVRITWGTQMSDFVIYLPLILKGGTAPAPNSIYYQVYRNTIDSTAGAVMLVDHHPGSPYDDTGASPGTVYFYWVRACNTGVCSGFSSSDSGYREGELLAPQAPDQVDASNGTYSDKVHLTWASSVGATFYKVYRYTIDNASSAITLSENHASSPYDDMSAVQGTTYFYWVKGCNSAGCSSFSSSDTGWLGINNLVNGDFEDGHLGWTEYSSHGWDLIMMDTAAPISAHNGTWLAWLGGGDDEISTLSQDITIPAGTPELNYWDWINSSDICYYDYAHIKINEITLLSYDLCLGNNSSGWIFEIIDLTDYVDSMISLKFEITTDSSSISNFFLDQVSLSAGASEPPFAPTGFSASDGAYMDKVRLSWDASIGATSYQVYRNTQNSHTGESLLSNSIVNNLFDDFTAAADTDLYYWVKACNSIGCSDYSDFDTGYLSSSELSNGDFELGDVGWTEYSTFAYDVIREFTPGSAHSGTWAAYLAADNTQNGINGVMQYVTVPASMPYLHFWHQIISEDYCGYDYGYVRVNGSDEKTFNLCVEGNTSGWTEAVVDLTVYASSTVKLEIEGDTDSTLDSYFMIDTVSFSESSTIMLKNPYQKKEPLQ